MNLASCLPEALQTPSTTITKIAVGLSGAGVYRVEAGDQRFVLKISDAAEPITDWRRKLAVQQAAADAGVAPRVVHADEPQRAILAAFVVDRSFPAVLGDPRTRDAAIALLGQTLRRVHDLPVPAGAVARDPRDLMGSLWAGPLAGFPHPAFVADFVARVRAEPVPATDRAPVLSHNDVNPTNLAYDGEHLLLLDWDTAAPNDAFYDLAAIAVFLRFDDATCLRLLAAHDGAPVAELPALFHHDRRLVSALCGTLFLFLARQAGHPGATGAETLETTTGLAELYLKMRTGGLDLTKPEGRWAFGLALIKSGHAL